jgi:hypothetical protein
VNRDDIRQILLLYRPGSADAEDPQIAAALAVAKQDAELARWLEEHCARQSALSAKFRQLEPPAGLREQIISEHAASRRRNSARHKIEFALAGLALLLFGLLAAFWLPHRAPEDTLAIYQSQMARIALGPYAMDLMTNDPVPIRAYLAQNHAPSDFVPPARLQQTALAGCAVESWQGARVSLVCFRTGKPLAPGAASDLWLFVVDRTTVRNAPERAAPQLAKVNRLITASWTQGDKLYFLGTRGEEPDIKQYLR